MTRQPSHDRESVDFKTGRIVVLALCHFIHDIYSSFLSPLLPLLIEKLSMSLTQAAFLSSVMQIPALMNPYIGILADRISVRYFIILAPALTAVPMSLIGTAPSYGILLILLFITGISVSLFHVPSPVMISRLDGFFMMASFMARSAIVVLVGLIGDLIGLRATYFVSAIMGLTAIPFILMLPKRNL